MYLPVDAVAVARTDFSLTEPWQIEFRAVERNAALGVPRVLDGEPEKARVIG